MARYSKKASSSVERAMKKLKAGTLKSGRSGRKVRVEAALRASSPMSEKGVEVREAES